MSKKKKFEVLDNDGFKNCDYVYVFLKLSKVFEVVKIGDTSVGNVDEFYKLLKDKDLAIALDENVLEKS